jgi:3-hydroxy-3-methylglutaryl CoA synthase
MWVKGAFDAVTAGSAKNVLITSADCRLAYPRSDQEQVFGDGAAAFAVGNNSAIATMEASFSINKEIVDVWRNDDASDVTLIPIWLALTIVLTQGL